MRAFVFQKAKASEIDFPQQGLSSKKGAFTWLHLDGSDAEARPWMENHSALPDFAQQALSAIQTRPRGEALGDGILLNLRGQREAESPDDELVSVRIWAEQGRCISLAYRDPVAVPDVIKRFLAGTIRDPGDLLVAFADANADFLAPMLNELGDALDACEVRMEKGALFAIRREVAQVRAQAIGYRRFIAPQRQALDRIAQSNVHWLDGDDRAHLRDAADRAARFSDELEAARERAALMHEELTDRRAEQLDSRALLISIVALVFLPLTFVTGLLGMNVKGIPLADSPWAFWGVVGFCVATGLAMTLYFVHAHWISRD